jgi:SAM-dependent methyltransferase
MKILESGCGMGRWVFYFHRLGFDITGLDWSQNTIDLIKSYDDTIKITKGDARKSDFKDGEFDLVLSLGTVEHTIEGPSSALNDAFRILKGNGILIITVPILNRARIIIYSIKNPVQRIKAYIRGKYIEYNKLKHSGIDKLYMNICYENNNYNIIEYRFPLKEFKSYIESSGFQVLDILSSFHHDGLFKDLGSLVGRLNYEKGIYPKNILGNILYRLFPKTFPHMICCVAKKDG